MLPQKKEIGYSHPLNWMAHWYITCLPTASSHTRHTYLSVPRPNYPPRPKYPDPKSTPDIPIWVNEMDVLWVVGVQLVISICTSVPSVFAGVNI